ncbi:hypothetical protein WJX77_011104 [Trebouxia sp. C0004]
MEDELEEGILQALALSMQEWDGQGSGDHGSHAIQALPDADPTLQDMDIDDDLQQAMALSMQGQYADDEPAPPPDTVMLTEQQQAAAAVPPAQQQTHQPAAAPSAPQPVIQSNVFAAALAQAMGVLNQQQGVPQAESIRQAATRPAKVYAAAPAWIEAAVSDLKRPLTPAGSGETGASFPPEDELPIVAALEKALGMPVKAVQGTSAAPAGIKGIILRLTMDPKTDSSWWLGNAQIDIAIKTKLRPARGGSQLQTMHDCHNALELGCQAATSPAVKQVLSRWQSRIAKQAGELVGKEEEEDLYFEGGHHSQEFVKLVGCGKLQSLFVEAVVNEARTEKDMQVWQTILRSVLNTLKQTTFTNAAALQSNLFALDVFFRQPLLQRLLAALLLEEAAQAAGKSGQAVEASSVLAPLLSVSTVPDNVRFMQTHQVSSQAKDFFTSLRRYPNMRSEVEVSMRGLRAALGNVYRAAHGVCERLVKLKGTEPAGVAKEAVVAWISAAAGTSTVRTSGGESKGAIERAPLKHGSSDAFSLGLLGLCLLFCKPFLGGEQKHLDRLDISYYSQFAYRLPEVAAAQTLAGRDNSEGPASFSGCPYVSQQQPGPSNAHFVAECFFLTQRVIHTCLMPSVYRFQQVSDILYRRNKQQQQQQGDEDREEDEAQSLDMWLLTDSTLAQLMDPQLAAPAVQFLVLEATWLLKLAKQDPQTARKAFAKIPDYVIRDMTAWLSFVIRGGQPDLLASCRLDILIAFLVEMLQRGDLVQSPIIQAKIVELLLTMLSPQLGRRRSKGVLGPSHQGVGEQALVAAVLGTGAAQEQLVPALMVAYAAADHVVGLDVDKDQFDKFGMRNCIDNILLELWKDPGCAASLTRLAAKSRQDTTFSQYAAAVLNSLVYLLKDSLERLQDIHNIEASMADEAAWKALPPRERADKESFYEGQGKTAGGFMHMALTTLALLNKLSAHPVIKQSFLQPPLVGSAAYNCLHFLELLVGSQGVGLKVKDPKKYHFDPKSLLLQICEVLLRLAEDSRFVDGVAGEPDYEEPVLRKAHHILTSKQLGEYEHAARLDKLIAQVAERRQVAAPPGAAAASATPPSQQQVMLPDLSFPTAAPANPEASYEAALEPLSVSDFDSSATGAYNRAFAVMAQQVAGDTQTKMKRLSREMRNLRGKTSLPIHMASSIFVRHDTDRMDKVRALITGPEGTPYHGGCYMFDVFFPQDYPNVPPLMNMATNGEGRARFNPNLYADGKVCLSLLGTWHGTDASQKWDPQNSSLFQILLSIQGMILISDPYFNEPNVEQMRGQTEGNKASSSYNAEIHLNNIRWGMIDQLRKPKPGFERVIKAHFSQLRHILMDQCKKWFEESADLDALYRRRLADAIVELHGLLAAL